MHLGLIGGIGPAATTLYYRGLVARHTANMPPLELTIAHADLATMARHAAAGDARAQAEVFLVLVRRLAAAGAQAAAITSMGGHFCIDELISVSPIPILNAVPIVGAALRARGLRRIGMIGTRQAMQSGLYGGLAGMEVVLPAGAGLDRTHDLYVGMATAGVVTDAQRAAIFAIGRKLIEKSGVEAVLLAGTDLFLAFDGQHCGYPVIDSAALHIDALHQATLG